MMNLLHNYDIQFDDEDKIANWADEYNCGITKGDAPRSIDKDINSDYPADVSVIKTDTDNMEWDSSCGVYGVAYSKGVTHEGLKYKTCSKLYTNVSKLDSVWDDEDFESPWTWDGAPEFKDWSYSGNINTEIATLE